MRKTASLPLIAVAIAGAFGALTAARDAAPQGPASRYVRWQHPQGFFSAEVPAGWRVDGQIDPQGLDKGAFMIQAFAPDGRSMFSFAHNWLWFMEYQYGRYRPGHATVESLVLPNLPQNLPRMGLANVRVTYRSANTPFQMANPQTGLPIRTDRGTLGILAIRGDGVAVAGSLMGETLYIPMAGTPGLWGLRIFAGGLAPATAADQAAVRAALARAFDTLRVSAQFQQIWQQAHAQTVQRMQEYSRQMDQVLKIMGSIRESRARRSKDPMDGWAEMMRDGHYESDARTGEQYWVGNDHRYWFKNDQGRVVGNNTGTPPADNSNWHPLAR